MCGCIPSHPISFSVNRRTRSQDSKNMFRDFYEIYISGSCIERDRVEFNNISCLVPSCSLLKKNIILPPFDFHLT